MMNMVVTWSKASSAEVLGPIASNTGPSMKMNDGRTAPVMHEQNQPMYMRVLSPPVPRLMILPTEMDCMAAVGALADGSAPFVALQ